jgi:hypothetical protein
VVALSAGACLRADYPPHLSPPLPACPMTPQINPQSSTVVAKFEVQHCSQDPLGCS